MFASRLPNRRAKATEIKIKTITGTVEKAGLKAAHQQTEVQERSGPLNEVSTKVVDLFFFDRDKSGSFPTITESSVLEWNSTDYNVRNVRQLDQLANRLRVETERAR